MHLSNKKSSRQSLHTFFRDNTNQPLVSTDCNGIIFILKFHLKDIISINSQILIWLIKVIILGDFRTRILIIVQMEGLGFQHCLPSSLFELHWKNNRQVTPAQNIGSRRSSPQHPKPHPMGSSTAGSGLYCRLHSHAPDIHSQPACEPFASAGLPHEGHGSQYRQHTTCYGGHHMRFPAQQIR